METFLATWKFESSDNFDEYLKALGISAPLRKLAGLTSPTVTIKKLEDGKIQGQRYPMSNSNLLLGKYSVTTDAVVRSVTVTFRFGEEVQESTVGEKPD